MRYAARQTGLKPHLIRTWEERYGAVSPERSPTNHRLYSDADIRRLTLLKEAVDAGHAISAVAALSEQELAALLQKRGAGAGQRHDETPPRDAPRVGPPVVSAKSEIEAALDRIRALDAGGLEHVLTVAAVEMTRQSFLQDVILPLFNRIGELWREGSLKIVNEHMASLTVRAMLWDMLRTTEVADTAPCIVVATPVGHWHEFGALASALAAAESGWKACYLGPNLPSEEIAYAARKLEARALCLSVCHQLDDRNLPVEITRLRRAVGHRLPLFVGGAGADIVAGSRNENDIKVVNDLARFRRHLEILLRKSSA